MKIITKLLLLTSFIIAENNYSRCGFTSTNNRSNVERPSLDTFVDIGFFRIHYDLDGNNAPEQVDDGTIQIYLDYIEELGEAATYSYDFMINTLGYEENAILIISDCDDSDDCGNLGGNALYDIYVKDLPVPTEIVDEDEITYGSNESSQGSIEGTSFIVIDNGFTETDYYTPGLDAMKVTIAHELFHAIQRSYREFTTSADRYFYEMSSAWIEDIIYPNINDYIADGWTNDFFKDPDGKKINETNGYSIALYAHYLTSVVHDNSIIKEIWEKFGGSTISSAHSSINDILELHDTNFMTTWVAFCSHNFFNSFYPDMTNNFYYYPDQVYTQPITISDEDFIAFDDEISISNFEFNSSSARIIGVDNIPENLVYDIGLDTDLLNFDVIGNIIFLSENSEQIIDIYNISEEYSGTEYIYLILGSSSVDSISFDIFFCDDQKAGDISEDCMINIRDYIELVDIIITDTAEENTDLCDMNDDKECNIDDVLLLLNQIQTVP